MFVLVAPLLAGLVSASPARTLHRRTADHSAPVAKEAYDKGEIQLFYNYNTSPGYPVFNAKLRGEGDQTVIMGLDIKSKHSWLFAPEDTVKCEWLQEEITRQVPGKPHQRLPWEKNPCYALQKEDKLMPGRHSFRMRNTGGVDVSGTRVVSTHLTSTLEGAKARWPQNVKLVDNIYTPKDPYGFLGLEAGDHTFHGVLGLGMGIGINKKTQQQFENEVVHQISENVPAGTSNTTIQNIEPSDPFSETSGWKSFTLNLNRWGYDGIDEAESHFRLGMDYTNDAWKNGDFVPVPTTYLDGNWGVLPEQSWAIKISKGGQAEISLPFPTAPANLSELERDNRPAPGIAFFGNLGETVFDYATVTKIYEAFGGKCKTPEFVGRRVASKPPPIECEIPITETFDKKTRTLNVVPQQKGTIKLPWGANAHVEIDSAMLIHPDEAAVSYHLSCLYGEEKLHICTADDYDYDSDESDDSDDEGTSDVPPSYSTSHQSFQPSATSTGSPATTEVIPSLGSSVHTSHGPSQQVPTAPGYDLVSQTSNSAPVYGEPSQVASSIPSYGDSPQTTTQDYTIVPYIDPTPTQVLSETPVDENIPPPQETSRPAYDTSSSSQIPQYVKRSGNKAKRTQKHDGRKKCVNWTEFKGYPPKYFKVNECHRMAKGSLRGTPPTSSGQPYPQWAYGSMVLQRALFRFTRKGDGPDGNPTGSICMAQYPPRVVEPERIWELRWINDGAAGNDNGTEYEGTMKAGSRIGGTKPEADLKDFDL